MKIFVKAKPNAREEKIEKISENSYVVSVKAPPVQGQANRAIIEVLAIYFKVPKSCVNIVAGHTSKQKIVEIQ